MVDTPDHESGIGSLNLSGRAFRRERSVWAPNNGPSETSMGPNVSVSGRPRWRVTRTRLYASRQVTRNSNDFIGHDTAHQLPPPMRAKERRGCKLQLGHSEAEDNERKCVAPKRSSLLSCIGVGIGRVPVHTTPSRRSGKRILRRFRGLALPQRCLKSQ
jgi:hypothetical protein